MINEANQPQKTSGQPTRLVRTLSRTRKEGEDYRKDIATIETDLPPGMDVPEAFDRLEATLEAHLKIGKALGQAKSSPEPKSVLDPRELDKLDWRLYHPPHRAGWTFSDRAPRSLVELLEKQGSADIGEFHYKLSGPAEQPRLFVARTPIKDSQP